MGIYNAFQFSQLSDHWIRHNMTVVGLRLKHDFQGISSIDFEDIKPKKNIACTRSFEKMYNNIVDIQERVSTFTAMIGEKLRMQNSHCNLISVFTVSNYFRTDLEQHKAFFTIKTDFPTNSTLEINRIAQNVLKSLFQKGIYYKKAGVIVSGITPTNAQQFKLFGGESPKHVDLMRTIDLLNKKTSVMVKFGGNDYQNRHKMNRNHLSPCYTARFSNILTIKL